MSIVQCKVCKKEVSKTAPVCPHCGEIKPGKTKGSSVGWLVGAGLLVAAGFGLVTCTDDAAEKVVQPPKLDDAVCAKDLQCFGEKALLNNQAQCITAIEKLAKHEVKWVDTMLESKFSKFKWRSQDNQIITVLGDKVRFQNGFGVFTKIIYECDVQQTGDQWAVLRARVKEGSFAD